MSYVRLFPVEVNNLKPGRDVFVGIERGIGILKRIDQSPVSQVNDQGTARFPAFEWRADVSTSQRTPEGKVTPITVVISLFEKSTISFISSPPPIASCVVDVAAALEHNEERIVLSMRPAKTYCSSALENPTSPNLVLHVKTTQPVANIVQPPHDDKGKAAASSLEFKRDTIKDYNSGKSTSDAASSSLTTSSL